MTDSVLTGAEEDPSDLDSEEGDVEVSFSTHKTARQLAADSKDSDSYLQELGRVVKKSKYDGLTESEIALRREENARRRKNQTDQRLEEEKQEVCLHFLYALLWKRAISDSLTFRMADDQSATQQAGLSIKEQIG